jgi:hypothetical protein
MSEEIKVESNSWGRVAVGVRIGMYPDPAFFDSWTMLLINGLRNGDIVLQPAVNRPHALAANYLVQQFLASPCDSLLFLDDDMEFEPRTLETLRESPEKFDMIGGLYPCRRAPFAPVVLLKQDDGRYAYPQNMEMAGPFIVTDVVGLGFTLVKRSILQKVNDAHPQAGAFTWTNDLGEDGHFCEELKAAGGICGINTNCSVGHRVTFTARWNVKKNAVNMKFNAFGGQPPPDGAATTNEQQPPKNAA